MAVTIVTTPGADTANSYATVAETDAFAESTFAVDAAAWAALGDEEEVKAPFLARAARLLDTTPVYLGDRATTAQAMEWPRSNVQRPGGGGIGYFQGYDSTAMYGLTEIPSAMKTAQMQLAVWLSSRAQTGDDTFGLSGTGGLSSLRVGPIALDFRETAGTDGMNYFDEAITPILESAKLIRRAGRLTR